MNKKTAKRLKEKYEIVAKKYNAIMSILENDYGHKNESKEACFDKIIKIAWSSSES
jgi:hypothetical protein